MAIGLNVVKQSFRDPQAGLLLSVEVDSRSNSIPTVGRDDAQHRCCCFDNECSHDDNGSPAGVYRVDGWVIIALKKLKLLGRRVKGVEALSLHR